MQKYMIVVDMQKDFIDGALGTPEARAILPHAVRRIEDAIREGRTLYFTLDTHYVDYLESHEGRHLPVPHCVMGTDGWRLHEAIAPYAGTTVKKSGFGSVALNELLKDVAEHCGANIDVSLLGVCTDICVVSNALLLRSFFPEATLRVFSDSCAGVTPETHQAALTVLRACQVEVV